MRFDPEKHFDAKLAAAYDEKISMIIPGYDSLHEMAYTLLAEQLGRTGSVLVAGCGTGREVKSYLVRNPDWKIVGIEPSASMLAIAKDRLKRFNLLPLVELHHGYVETQVFSQQFDSAVSLLVMHYIPNDGSKERFLSALHERLTSGGQIVIADLVGSKGSPQFDQQIEWWKRYQISLGLSYDEVRENFQHVDRDICFIDEDELVALLLKVGFRQPTRFYQGFMAQGFVAVK